MHGFQTVLILERNQQYPILKLSFIIKYTLSNDFNLKLDFKLNISQTSVLRAMALYIHNILV